MLKKSTSFRNSTQSVVEVISKLSVCPSKKSRKSVSVRGLRVRTFTFIPNEIPIFTTSCPMPPKPMTPKVFPSNSTAVEKDFFKNELDETAPKQLEESVSLEKSAENQEQKEMSEKPLTEYELLIVSLSSFNIKKKERERKSKQKTNFLEKFK